MNIGFLTPEYVSPERLDGGLANYLQKVARELTARGHRVAVFVVSDRNAQWNDGKVEVIEVGRVKPAQYFRIAPYRLRELLPAWVQIRSAKRLENAVWKYHRETPLDVLQTSSYAAPGFTLRRNGRIPLVCRVSSYTPLIRSAFGRRRTLPDYLTDWLEVRQVLDADAAFAPSELIAGQYERIEGFRPAVLRSPVDWTLPAIDDSIYRERFSAFSYFLFFGTLSRVKGVDLIADAIPQILKNGGDTHFVFIGRDDGMPDGRKMMEYVMEKCGEFKDSIHYIPAIQKSQLYSIIAHAIAVLMPSRIDNYPNACLEALRMEVPVIGTRGSSVDEMVVHEETGLLVDNGNAADLAAAMNKFATIDAVRMSGFKEQIRRHNEIVSQQDRIEQLLCLYRSLTGRRVIHPPLPTGA